MKRWLPKKRLHFDVGCHFCKIKAHVAILRRFSHILPKFPQIFPGFSPGCSCTPVSYTSGLRPLMICLEFYMSRSMTQQELQTFFITWNWKVHTSDMGVGRIFFQLGATRGFFLNFSVGGKSSEIWFFPLKTKKTTFFAGPPCPPFRRPWYRTRTDSLIHDSCLILKR